MPLNKFSIEEFVLYKVNIILYLIDSNDIILKILSIKLDENFSFNFNFLRYYLN